MRQLYILITLLIFSCSSHKNEQQHSDDNSLHSVELKYAKAFEIKHNQNEVYITIKNPSNNSVVQELVISNSKPKLSEAIWIKQHPKSVASSSVTHVSFLHALNKTNYLTGFSQTKYIYNSSVRTQIENGETQELNSEGEFNLEKAVKIHPDVFFVSGLLGKLPQFEKLSSAGIPVVEVVEWVEVHPLARAEWIKFFAAFYGEFALADSLFNQIENDYLSTIALTKDIAQKPLIMSGKSYKGTWYMPGGRNFSSILTHDAGGFYPYYESDTNTNSLPLSLEKVAKDFLDADIWISPGASSINELLKEDERYSAFKPVKTNAVYEANKRALEGGANDFWETGLLRPDMLLKDLVKIFHPSALPQHELYFYKKLE
jgi:iron complex transport system substrate-binding protein